MKVILFMAQTLNGKIARDNYDEDFISDDNWEAFVKLAEKIGCFVVGRKTYENVEKWKYFNFDNIKANKIIVSKNLDFKLNKDWTLANSPKDCLKKAISMRFNKILLSGGGSLNSSFMKLNLIDEIIINVEPYILGEGINIFKEDNFEAKLKLIKTKKLSSGILQLNYLVKKK